MVHHAILGRTDIRETGRTNGWAPQAPPAKIVICGSGNAGHALVVAVSQRFEGSVAWLVGSEERAALLRRRVALEGLESTGVIVASARSSTVVSSEPSAVNKATRSADQAYGRVLGAHTG